MWSTAAVVLWTMLVYTSAFSSPPNSRKTSILSGKNLSPLYIGNLFENVLPSAKKTEQNVALVSELKDEIRSLAAGTSNGIEASEEVRMEIDNRVRRLEAMNPTSDLTSSDKLDGSWTLVYSTNGGSSAGKLGPFVGDVEQLIRLGGEEQDDYINYVRLGGGAVEGALTATWDNESANKWKVKFQSIRFRILGITVVEKDLEATGIWRKTYLDDDFRILYAIGGKNTVQENIYILSK